MFGQMYVPVSMLTRIGNTLKDTNTHTQIDPLTSQSNSTHHSWLVRSLEPPICSFWWLWPLCVVHDLKMSFSAEIIERFRSSHQRWLMATYTHTNKNTRRLGLDLSYIYQQIKLKYAKTCRQIQIYTLSDSPIHKHSYKHTNMHTHAHTLRHTTTHISRDSAKRVRPFGRSWILTELTDGRRKTPLPSS